MHAAAPEPGSFAGGVQPVEHAAVGFEHPRVEVGFQAAQRLSVKMCSLTAISGPAFGSVRRCGATTRLSRSPRYPPAARIAMTWVSLVNLLATSRSRAVTSASTVANYSGVTPGTVFIADTNSRMNYR